MKRIIASLVLTLTAMVLLPAYSYVDFIFIINIMVIRTKYKQIKTGIPDKKEEPA